MRNLPTCNLRKQVLEKFVPRCPTREANQEAAAASRSEHPNPASHALVARDRRMFFAKARFLLDILLLNLMRNAGGIFPDSLFPDLPKTNEKGWATVVKELDHLQAVDVELRHPTVVPAGPPLPR